VHPMTVVPLHPAAVPPMVVLVSENPDGRLWRPVSMMVGMPPTATGSAAVRVTVHVSEPPRCTVGDDEVLVRPVSASTHTAWELALLGWASPPAGVDGRCASMLAVFG